MISKAYQGKSILLFDGKCNLCNRWVQFVLKQDKHDQFRFAPLQSESGKKILSSCHFKLPPTPGNTYKTIILIENNEKYTQSTAVLRILQSLSGGWRIFSVFILIPKPFRDAVYRIISRYRYSLFGKRAQCMVPSKKWEKKFIAQN